MPAIAEIRDEGAARMAFISYAHQDADRADRIRLALERAGVQTFTMAEKAEPGSVLAAVLSEAIEKASVFIVLISKASTSSHWVRHEIAYALSRRAEEALTVIPVLLDRVEVPPLLSSLLYLDLTDERRFAEGLPRLIAACKSPARDHSADATDAIRLGQIEAEFLADERSSTERSARLRREDLAKNLAWVLGISVLTLLAVALFRPTLLAGFGEAVLAAGSATLGFLAGLSRSVLRRLGLLRESDAS